MANTLLTPTAVTREALRILHEKLSFIGTINRQYDDSFARSGAKIGDTLTIRLPNQYTVRTGKTLNAQDTTERSTTLAVSTQTGVDVNFSSVDLTMDIDDFSSRILEPAMAVVASDMEATVLQGVTQDIYSQVGVGGTPPNDLVEILDARTRLNKQLAPKDNQRYLQLDSAVSASVVNGLSGLFHESTQIARQYREGMMGRAAGFDWYENERIYVHTNTDDVTSVAIDDAAGTNLTEGTTTLHIDGLGTDFPAGTIFTIGAGGGDVLAVHPETKQSLGYAQQFVVVSDATVAGNEGDVTISPAIYTSGPLQNVDHMPSDNDAVNVAEGASEVYEVNLAYHRDVAAFATADLIMPGGVDFAAREVYDGVSMRIVRQYDINNDNFPCRIDVLWGWSTIRPELGCRIAS